MSSYQHSGVSVLYEDNHIIIVNKRPSDIVQGDKTGDAPLSEIVKQYIKHKYNKPADVFLGVVHRIDRPASGAVIFARTSKALARLNKMLEQHEIHKFYWAVVKNKPPANEARLTHYLRKVQEKNKSFVVDKDMKGALKAEMQYRLIAHSDNYYLLEVELFTGRHHQIRVQLSATGCPIKGDVKYGFERTNKDASIHLHARKVEFIHPVKNELISITAPPPDEALWNVFVKTAS